MYLILTQYIHTHIFCLYLFIYFYIFINILFKIHIFCKPIYQAKYINTMYQFNQHFFKEKFLKLFNFFFYCTCRNINFNQNIRKISNITKYFIGFILNGYCYHFYGQSGIYYQYNWYDMILTSLNIIPLNKFFY